MSQVNILELLKADSHRPEHKQVSVREFYDLYKTENIPWIPHPHLQRNSNTWPKGMNQKIIESIVTNKLVNPIIISNQPDGKAFILEGAHRSDEIVNFIDNNFAVYGKKISQWTACERELFMRKSIKIVAYHGLSCRDEEDIMKRVNLGLQFTIGEHINATPSIPICNLAKKLGDRYQRTLIENTKCLQDNIRGESSLFAFMILRNFMDKRMISTEQPKPEMAAEYLDKIEEYRFREFSESDLTHKFGLLMRVFEQPPLPSLKLHAGKYTRYMVMTIQHILIENPNVRPLRIRRFLEDLYTTPKTFRKGHQMGYISEWFDNVPSSNPSSVKKCQKRGEAFKMWQDIMIKNGEMM